MIPPTPTPLAAGSSLFTIGESYSLWGAVPNGVQFWHMAGTPTTLVIQSIVLIALVVIGMAIVLKFIRQFTRRDAES